MARTAEEVQNDRERLLESVNDGLAVAQQLEPSWQQAVLPAVISAVITSKSLGGILRRLFGVSNRDLPYAVQTNTYPLAATAAAVGAQTTSDLNITQDSDFYAMRMAITVGNDGTGTADVLLQIVRNATGMRIMSNQNGGHILGYQGTGQRPFVWPNPLFIPRNQSLTFLVTNLTAAARGPFYIDLIGRKTVDVSALDITTRRY